MTISLSGAGTVTHTVTLSWTASTSTVVGYHIYRGTTAGGPYTLQSNGVVTGTGYTDLAVMSGSQYFYVARAVDSNNIESINSNEASASIP